MKAAFIAKHKTIFMQRKENFQTADEKMQILAKKWGDK